MNVKELIKVLKENFQPDDKVCLSIKVGDKYYHEAYLEQVYRDPEDEDCPVLSNEDEDGNW